MNPTTPFILFPLFAALPLIATSASPASSAAADPRALVASPLIAKVRAATGRYRDVNVAIAEGFVQATPCVSGQDFGAMGVHFLMPSRLSGSAPSADEPQALIYEPLPGGRVRFVAVEYIVLAAGWDHDHPAAGAPVLDGHLLNLVGTPNRYGLPAFYEMHVWAWAQNPVGSYADWNTQVSCDQQPID